MLPKQGQSNLHAETKGKHSDKMLKLVKKSKKTVQIAVLNMDMFIEFVRLIKTIRPVRSMRTTAVKPTSCMATVSLHRPQNMPNCGIARSTILGTYRRINDMTNGRTLQLLRLKPSSISMRKISRFSTIDRCRPGPLNNEPDDPIKSVTIKIV